MADDERLTRSLVSLRINESVVIKMYNFWNKSCALLRDKLAGRFDDADDISRIVDDAGIPRERLRLNGTPVNAWHDILRIAAQLRRIRELERVVASETDGDARLAELFSACFPNAPEPDSDDSRRLTLSKRPGAGFQNASAPAERYIVPPSWLGQTPCPVNPNSLAEVYVGKQDGNGEKKYGGFATGYPIAMDRVITAGHVFSGDYNFIEVRFRNSKENAGLIPAKMREWPGSAKFDVAVLSCAIPKDVPGNPSLLADHDASSTKGRVLGYPRVDDTHNKPGDARKLCDSTGELGALESIALHFEFQVDYDFRAQGQGWKGLSGAPVFLESRIAGIVQEYLGYATVAKFRVVAMCRLLEDPSFRAAIGWLDGPGEDVRQRTRESIERWLKRLSSDVLRNLAAQLHRKGDPALQEGEDLTPIILTILLERRRFSTISRLSKIHEKLCEAGGWDEADIVAEIIEEVTPLVIDPGLAHQLWNEIHDRMSAFCFVPDHYSTTIEVLMSRGWERHEVQDA